MLTYTESQQGYCSPTHPAQFPGEDKKGKPVNGKREWNYPILYTDQNGELFVQKSADIEREGQLVPIKEDLSTVR